MNTILTLLSEPSLHDFTALGYWRQETIYQLVATHASRDPEAVAVRERCRVVRYRQLVDASDRLAGALADAGLREGDRVAIWLPSRAEVAIAVLACSRAGFVACPSLHRGDTIAGVVELIGVMRASAVIMQAGYGADTEERDLLDAIEALDCVKFALALTRVHPTLPFPNLTSFDAGQVRANPNSIVYLAFTSGTTGRPKGVMHSDSTLLAPTRGLASDWSLDATSRIYSMSPLSHNLGFGAMILAMTVGAEFVVHDLPRGASLARRLQETKASFIFGVPAHAIDLLAELRDDPDLDLHELRGFRISGAAVSPILAQELLDRNIVPQSGYGMTEAGSHHYTLPDTPPDKIIGSSGRACAGYEVAIFSQQDAEEMVGPGKVGQIGGRGASLMLGYFDNQLATESSFNSTGWFMTGDLGWLDDEGYLHIAGRKKDLIIRGGHNIFPARIENLVMRHPAVSKAAAVPVPDDRLGERVCLVLQLHPRAELSVGKLFEHLWTTGLSRSDMPEYLGFVETLPMTASGKIFRRGISDLLDQGSISVESIRFRTPPATATGGS